MGIHKRGKIWYNFCIRGKTRFIIPILYPCLTFKSPQ